MHELSVALEICRIAEDRLVRVGVDLGDDAGLEPDNLQFCLETLLSQPPFGAASPAITRLAGDALRVTYLEIDDGRPDD